MKFKPLLICLLSIFSFSLLANAEVPRQIQKEFQWKFTSYFMDAALSENNAFVKPAFNSNEIRQTDFQLYSHGRPGKLLLGGRWLNAVQILEFVKSNKLLSSSVTQLNIYGCEFAKGSIGLNAVKYLEDALKIGISASNNITGKDGDWVLEIGKSTEVVKLNGFLGNLQCTGGGVGGTAGGDDFDGDGICNDLDIDVDNDGIFDAIESPSCFLSASEWNTADKSAFVTVSSDLTTLSPNTNFAAMTDNATANAIQFSTTPAQSQNDKGLFIFNFLHPVKLDAIYIRKASSAAISGGNVIVEGTNDLAATWTTLSTAASPVNATNITVYGAVSLPNSNKYAITQNSNYYKYYRIKGVTANNVTSGIATEAYFDVNSLQGPFVSSLFPKATCTGNDFDGDGVTNHFDLDSDGDGCPDAKEAITYNHIGVITSPGDLVNTSGTTTMVAGAKVSGPYGGNGFADALQKASPDTNYYIYDYYTYQNATDTVKNMCRDSDSDGIANWEDLDDDNDGITDKLEAKYIACTQPQVCTSWFTPSLVATDSSVVEVNGMTVKYKITVTGPTSSDPASSYFNTQPTTFWTTLQCGLGTMSGFSLWLEAKLTGGKITITFDKPVTDMQFVLSAIEDAETVTVTTNNTASQQYVCASCVGHTSITSHPSINKTVVVGGGSNAEIFKITGDVYTSVVLDMTVPANFYITLGFCALKSEYPNPYTPVDTDGDGIPNTLDLDSDGDACPDAVEGGANFIATDLVPSSMPGGNSGSSYNGTTTMPIIDNLGNSVATTGVNTLGIPTIANTGQTVYISENKDLQECTDFDGDGISDLIDIDDDNDGILDAVESPACYFTAAEANKISTITSQFPSPDDDQADGDIQLLHDGATTLTFNFTAATFMATMHVDDTIFTIKYPTLVNLSSLTISDNITGTTTARGRLWGSVDGITYLELTNTDVNLSTTTPVTFTPNANIGEYKYYYIRTTVTGVLAAGNTIGEITSVLKSNYSPSAHPKPSCTNDTDMDGKLNQYDLDSDADGCYDSYEAGVTGSTKSGAVTDSVAPAPYGANGLSNGLENSDSSTTQVKYTQTYEPYAVTPFWNKCADTDNDGISDVVDIDDDNDGVLDAIESPSCYYSATEAATIVTVTSGLTTNDDQSDGDIQNMHDNTTSTTNIITSGQALASANIYTVKYPVAIRLTSLSITGTTANWGSLVSSAKLRGSVNGTTWVDLSTTVATNVGNPKIFTNTKDTVNSYQYYRIEGVATAPSTAITSQDITTVVNSTRYVPSLNQKLNCAEDYDRDGLWNHLDLNSDADGCTDSYESGVTALTGSGMSTRDSIVSGVYDGNGFANRLQAAVDTNTYKGIYTYVNAIDSNITNCPQSITPDTVKTKPTCPTCPVTACPVVNDVDTVGVTNYSTCGTPPTGYTVELDSTTGCVTYTPNGMVTDTAYGCISTCDSTGRCDTTIVIIAPPPPTPDTVTTSPKCPTCPVIVCAVVDDVDTTGVTNYSTCTPPPTGYTVELDSTTGCVTYTPNGMVIDAVKTCIVTCDPSGRCDTTWVFINPPPTPDTVTVRSACPTCPVTACPVVNDVDTVGVTNYSTCTPPPAGYTAVLDSGTGCVTYTPNGMVIDAVKTCIVTCDPSGRCDTTWVIIPPPITPDSVTVRPSCPTCPVKACVVADDIVVSSTTTYSSCGLTSSDSTKGAMLLTPDGCLIWDGNGTQTTTDTIRTCLVACNGSVCDTTYITILPAIPPYGPDTIIVSSPGVGTPLPPVCATGDDIPTGYINSRLSYCGLSSVDSTKGTLAKDVNGCLVWTSNSLHVDTIKTCIVRCADTVVVTVDGPKTITLCDTTYAFYVAPPKADTSTVKPACATCEVSICPTADDITVTSATVFSNCGIPPGYTTVSGPTTTGCLTIKPDPSNIRKDTVQTCVVACNGKVCDTTYIIIYPPLTPDTVITTASCPTCPVTACPIIDDVDTSGGGATYTSCGAPSGYTATLPDSKGCVTYTPNGMVKDTVKTCIVTCNKGICDTTWVIMPPPPPTPDTVTTTPKCPTCPVTVCAVVDDVDTSGVTNYSTCTPPPTGYTLELDSTTGCVTYTPNGMVMAAVKTCIVTCDPSGRCDTTWVFITPPITPDIVIVRPTCPTCPVTACPAVNDVDTTGVTNYSTCTLEPTGGYTTVLDSGTGCVTYTPSSPPPTDTVKTCIVTCDTSGRCDTTYVFIAPPPTPDTLIVTPPDATTPIVVCAVGDDLLGGASAASSRGTCGAAPIGYTQSAPDNNGCVTYTPDGTASGTDTAKACIVVCKDGICDTTYVFIAPPVKSDIITRTFTCSTCPVSACPTADDVNVSQAGAMVEYKSCDATIPGYILTGPDLSGCVSYEIDQANPPTASDTTCVIACVNGVCDTTFVILDPASVLPVKIANVGVKWSSSNAIVSWTTFEEQSTSHYEIERSIDGGSFTSVGKQNALGNSSVINRHSFTDPNIKPRVGSTVSYRMVYYDIDGQKTYSEVVTLRVSSEEAINYVLYPNPNGGERINFNNLKDVKKIQIYNALGQIVRLYSKIDSSVKSYNLNGLSVGYYRVALYKADGKIETLSMVVQY